VDLQDGQSIEIKGSAAKPYTVRNVGGVYSCSCPAWRNQNAAIDKRTCKHIKQFRGAAAEALRLSTNEVCPSTENLADGQLADYNRQTIGTGISGMDTPNVLLPGLLLAESWDGVMAPTGWWMSEKLDGVRAYWDGEKLISRLGNKFYAPEHFLSRLKQIKDPLDGELWMGRKLFQKTVSLVRRQKDEWKDVYYLVFDAPAFNGTFEQRQDRLTKLFTTTLKDSDTVFPVTQTVCAGVDHLKEYLAGITSNGGEGVMLRQPGSKYEAGRSRTLLKVKNFKDEEATVVAHLGGRGKHKGRLGAVEVELTNGKKFRIGTGFSDAERFDPPPIGSVITFRYQELTEGGIPRFPAYVGRRIDVELKDNTVTGGYSSTSK
jgi:DNA ligase 1